MTIDRAHRLTVLTCVDLGILQPTTNTHHTDPRTSLAGLVLHGPVNCASAALNFPLHGVLQRVLKR